MVVHRPTGDSAAVVRGVAPRIRASVKTSEIRFMVATPCGAVSSGWTSIAPRPSQTWHVGLHGLLEREGRPAAERLAPNGAVVEIAHGAVHAMARIGVNDQLPFHAELLDHPAGQTF